MFQSRSFRSSPGTYLRCSLNSTEKPWNGLACKPARNPSTINLARRSSRATWRMTSGRKYFSGAFIRTTPRPREAAHGLSLFHQKCPIRSKETAVIDLIDALRLLGDEPASGQAQLQGRIVFIEVRLRLQRKHLTGTDNMLHE